MIHLSLAGDAVGLQRSQGKQGGLRPALSKLRHGLSKVLVALHDIDAEGVARGLFPVPAIYGIGIASPQVNAAQHGIDIGQKSALAAFREALPQAFQRPAGILGVAGRQLAAGQQAHRGEFNIRGAVPLDLPQSGHQGQHTGGDVLAFFKLAFGNGAIRQAHAIPAQNGLHRDTDGLIKQVIPAAPFAEVLAAVHNAGQGAGDRKGRQGHFLIDQQPVGRGNDGGEIGDAALRQGDIQPGQPAPGLPPGRVAFGTAAGKLRKRLVPALAALIIGRQGAQHTHALHQRRGGGDLLLRQAAVVFLHLAVMAHAGMKLGIAHQKLGDLGMIPCHGVALQRMAVILFQLVVEAAAAQNGAALFLAVFPVHLPQQKSAELRPEPEPLHIIGAQHGGIVLEPGQAFPGVGIAADHAGQLGIEALKWGKLQQKTANGQIEPAVDRRLEVEKDLVVALGDELRAIGAAADHAVGDDRHAQRVAAGFPQDLGKLRFADGGALLPEQAADILPVKKQGVGIQHRHKPGILEGHEPARHRPAGKQDEPAVAVLPDELVQRLLIRLLGHLPQVIDQEDLPVLIIRRQGEVRLPGGERKHLLPGKQRFGQDAFAKAAGRGEKQHPTPCHEFLVLFPDRRPDDYIFGHALPPFATDSSRGGHGMPKGTSPLMV